MTFQQEEGVGCPQGAVAVRVGEFAARAGVDAKTVRFYEAAGLLRPDGRTAAGYRVYSPRQLERLRFIRAARMLGFSLRDIGQMLGVWDGGRPPCDEVVRRLAAKVREVDEQIEHLRRLKRQLERLLEASQHPAASRQDAAGPVSGCVCHRVADLSPAR